MAEFDVDVFVVGAGAAGIAAARAASEEKGCSVMLASAGAGGTEMGAGWVSAGEGNTWEFPGGMDAALAWLPAVGLRAAGNYSFATLTGMPVGAVSGLRSLLDLATLPEGPLGVLDLPAGPAWFPDLVARSIHDVTKKRVRVVTPSDGAPRADSPRELARALDASGMIDALVAAVRPALGECTALLCPPVLGLTRDDVYERLRDALGIPVGESGGLAQDAPGGRLARALSRGIPPGVESLRGEARVEATEGGGARVRVGGRGITAGAVVLATGGLAGGGVAFERGFVETAAGAPVWLPGEVVGGAEGAPSAAVVARGSEWGMDPQPWFSPDATGRVGATRAGVRLTPEGIVLGDDGRRAMRPWLFAAGGVVAGARGAYGATLGEALAQGRAAGARAARFAKGR